MRRLQFSNFVGSVLVVGCTACGSSPAAGDVQPIGSTTPVVTPSTAPAATGTSLDANVTTSSSPAAATRSYSVVSGDTLYGIASEHCVSSDELLAANSWPEGIDHSIFPGDVVAVPDVPCEQSGGTTIGTVATSSTVGGQMVTPAFYTPYGDPSDAYAIYETTECTSAHDAANDVTQGSGGDDPRAWMNQMVIALRDAVAALPGVTPEVLAAADEVVQFEPDLAVAEAAFAASGYADETLHAAMDAAWDVVRPARTSVFSFIHTACPQVGTSD